MEQMLKNMKEEASRLPLWEVRLQGTITVRVHADRKADAVRRAKKAVVAASPDPLSNPGSVSAVLDMKALAAERVGG